MALPRDPMLRLVRRLGVLCGTVLLDLDVVWDQGRSLAGWLVRIAFNALFLAAIALSRSDIDRVRLDEPVLARAGGTRGHLWQGVAVLFTATRVVSFHRDVIWGTIRRPLADAPLSAVELHHERHGAFFDSVRCEWPDGSVHHLRVGRRGMARLAPFVRPSASPHPGPFARMADWVRAATTYDE